MWWSHYYCIGHDKWYDDDDQSINRPHAMTIHSIIGNDLDYYYYYSTLLLLRDSLIIGSEYTCLHPIHSWKHHAMRPLAVRSIDRCFVETSFCTSRTCLVLQMGLLVLSCFTYHFPLPLHTCQSQSLGTSDLVTPSFSNSTTTVGVMKHGLVIMRVKATEDSLSVRVSMCVDTTNRWVDSSALYLQSLG
jgi:hypothetical protein